MKKTELQKLIREEIKTTLKEASYDDQSLQAASSMVGKTVKNIDQGYHGVLKITFTDGTVALIGSAGFGAGRDRMPSVTVK